MKKKDYFIGLDIGTDSVGWAATDTEYNLLKARGMDLWGSYLFKEAETAQERRINRGARRRLARKHYRLMLLQSLFKEEIEKVDSTFFLRLNDSKFLLTDKNKSINTKYVFFNDANFTDKEYYKKYPTIFHLRSDLIKNGTTDIRLLYLALHHLIKNRGHFLFERQEFNASDSQTAASIFYNINIFLSEREGNTFSLENIEKCLNIIKDIKLSKKERQKELKVLFNIGSDKQLISIICALTGGTVNLKDLYSLKEDFNEISKFSVASQDFNEKILPLIENALGTDEAELVRNIKAIFDWSILCDILNEKRYISEAKKEIFDKHKSDLTILKTYIRTNYSREVYSSVFQHKEKTNNYAAYIGMDKQHGYKKCSKDDFYAFLKNIIKVTDEYILSEIEKGTFMPKQISSANGVIPYQVNLAELKAILLNAEKNFSFLKVQKDGFSVTQKIISLMTFRVPYYVGPLNTASKKFAWVIKHEGEERTKITPWNIDKVVDKDASEEAFITRMTSKCSYLPTEDVLPMNSFLYSEFTFLNELNNLKINGEKNRSAHKLIYTYAKHHKKIILKSLLSLLIKEGVILPDSKKEIFSGTDGDFKSSLSSYIDFKNILGEKADTQHEMCEEIIKWITLISDKTRLEARIKSKYGKIITDEEIKKLKGLTYSKWGRLSRTLLQEIKCIDKSTGETSSIIQAMRRTGNNFMQLLSEKYEYSKAIKDYNQQFDDSDKVTYKTIEELYCSPSVKRAIWRSVCLVKEIIKIEGNVPKKVFIEMARGTKENLKGQRTSSRQQQLINLYNNIKDEKNDWLAEINNTEAGKFNSDKVIMYYRQMGKCMYTGETISFSSLFDTNIYDIDHIYPQAKLKDDSLDNRVLVLKRANVDKMDSYPISAEIRNKMTPFWNTLHTKKLISDEKYYRLTRNTPLSQEELADFINRQLVETRQSTKAAAEILKKMLPNTEIVYSKAKNADDFKNQNGIIKVRELNNLHHAKDAYINIVVGNVYNTKFGHNAAVYFKNNNLDNYDLRKLFYNDIKGAWKVSDKAKVLLTVNKNTCVVTRFTSEGSGALFNATIKTAGANNNLIPLKAKGAITDTSKYGGYDSAASAYFMLVKSKDKKGKTLLSLECMLLYVDKIIGQDIEKKIDYCRERLGLIDPEILIDKIKINTLFKVDGSYAYLSGRSKDRLLWCNANELFLNQGDTKYLKNITRYFESMKKLNKKDMPISEKYDGITKVQNQKLYNVFKEKISSQVYKVFLPKNLKQFLEDNLQIFTELAVENQCKVLIEILRFMQCNSVTSDLSLIGGANSSGKIMTDKYVQDRDVKIINQSPTGYYKKIIDLNRLLWVGER